jgi:hypothetical protein
MYEYGQSTDMSKGLCQTNDNNSRTLDSFCFSALFALIKPMPEDSGVISAAEDLVQSDAGQSPEDKKSASAKSQPIWRMLQQLDSFVAIKFFMLTAVCTGMLSKWNHTTAAGTEQACSS